MLLADANSEIDQYKLDKTSLRESQDPQETENWKGKIIRKFNVPKIDSIGSCSTFIDDNKENIIGEKSEIDTSTIIKFLKNEENEKSILKNISNKSCIKKVTTLFGTPERPYFSKTAAQAVY